MISSRTLHAVSAAAHLLVAIALGALAAAQASILLPVALSVPAAASIGVFASVDFAAAAAIVLLIGAAVHAVLALGLGLVRDSGGRAPRSLQLVAFAQSSGITLFLVAQLNGVTEVGALILVYAFGGGAAGLLWLQARESDDRLRARWPFSFGAGLAVVPWGIVALYQVVGLVAGDPPAPIVRVLTVLILIVVALAWWTERRWQLGLTTAHRASVLHAALSLANGVALLVLAVGLARPSALL
ncbi:hypothetical protein [Microcella humidisoli]|uniref:Uncharacterized protein n=1 Tax=Microcella humidisoli TaxID=2963406 RepID=A0ABY5FWF2_9MICO|nr:hypothetical protein [Microcella humidisoli]UTT62467.1 hypothetical protein NNL39_12565 [Microcella humidisoli]